ncbi:MAG: acyltransferase family protein [Candidatus Coprovivens sp.]
MKKRDNLIDIFRGIAVLSIIIIHTTFWSGSSYVPDYIKSLSLIIDVPLFIFISGMTFNFSNSVMKNIKGLFNIWKKYLIFLIPFYIYEFLNNRTIISLETVLSSVFFSTNPNSALVVVPGSIWFIFMFFIVSIICSVIISIYNKYNDNLNNFIYIILVSFIIYGMSLYKLDFIFISTNYLMYIFIYLLGYYLYNKKFKTIWDFLIPFFSNIIILLSLLKFGEYNYKSMQIAKFSSSLTYLSYSMISILIVTYLKDKIKLNIKPLEFIGQNAIVFYFSQGVSSSLLYLFVPLFNFHWIPKLLVLITINTILTLVFGYLLYLFINIVTKLLDNIANLICITDKES